MRFISGLTLFFYTLVFFLVGGLFIVIALNLVPKDIIISTIDTFYSANDVRLILGITGLLFIFISILVVQITMGMIQRERTIAFENPDGQVTISLTAIEDFIKKVIKHLPEVKEAKPSVRAGKKGITVINRVVLYSDINIPDTTEKIQHIVKDRVHDMLRVDEPVHIKVHVIKIAHKEETTKDTKKPEKIPQFKGSIEYGEV